MKKQLLLLIAITGFASSAFSQVIAGTYAIKNMQTGMLLRIKDANKSNGTPLVAYTPVNWKCMTWDFKHIEGQGYQLKNLYSGKTFQSAGSRPAPGASLEEQPLAADAAAQLYEFIPDGNNVYRIRVKDTDLYVTSSVSNGTVNAQIILARKEDQNNKLQQWTIYQQHPEM